MLPTRCSTCHLLSAVGSCRHHMFVLLFLLFLDRRQRLTLISSHTTQTIPLPNSGANIPAASASDGFAVSPCDRGIRRKQKQAMPPRIHMVAAKTSASFTPILHKARPSDSCLPVPGRLGPATGSAVWLKNICTWQSHSEYRSGKLEPLASLSLRWSPTGS